jgi:hypothetical protein
MGSHTDSSRTSALNRSARTSLALLVAFAVLMLALLLLERSGPAPVRPLLQNVSSTKTVTRSGDHLVSTKETTRVVPNKDKKPPPEPHPLKHCKETRFDPGKKGDDHRVCRVPSGARK